jgi:hypothetical protein
LPPLGGAPKPDAAPKDLRKVAFLHSADNIEACKRFAESLSSMGLTVSKTPLHVEPVLFAAVEAGKSSLTLLGQVRAAGATLTVAVLSNLSDNQIRDLEDVFQRQQSPLRFVSPEDASERSAAIDLLVDLTLMKPSA